MQKDALAALEANNHELKKRRIAVTLADSRVRARNRYVTSFFFSFTCAALTGYLCSNVVSDAGLSRMADMRSRSVRIRNLPAATQEGLLQQTLEKITTVKRVEVFVEICEAVVELENAAVGSFLFPSRKVSQKFPYRKRENSCYGRSL